MDLRVGSKYILRKRIGAGSFGEIYSGENISTHEEVAIKLEPSRTRPPQLISESKIYKSLSGAVGIPNFLWYGVEGDYNVLVMELLGKSLEEQLENCHHKFSLKTVLMVADQILTRIEYIHNKGYIHRDVKPDNFILGIGKKSNEIFAIDFGLSKKYRDSRTHQHIPFREGKPFTGTARYASINTHLGIEQSRRDDIESIAYILIYLLNGTLPWMGFHAENKKQKIEMIGENKIAKTSEQLCQGLPQEFATFLTEARRLEFNDRPDYAGYRQLFRDLFIKQGFVYDYQYDWVVKNKPMISPFSFAPVQASNNNDHNNQMNANQQKALNSDISNSSLDANNNSLNESSKFEMRRQFSSVDDFNKYRSREPDFKWTEENEEREFSKKKYTPNYDQSKQALYKPLSSERINQLQKNTSNTTSRQMPVPQRQFQYNGQIKPPIRGNLFNRAGAQPAGVRNISNFGLQGINGTTSTHSTGRGLGPQIPNWTKPPSRRQNFGRS